MRKLRVGVWLGKKSVVTAEAGGGHGYYHQIINKISSHQFKDAEIIFLANEDLADFTAERKHTIQWRPYFDTSVGRLNNLFYETFRHGKIKENRQLLMEELKHHADVIYYPTPACEFPDFPYVYTLWDLGHRSTYALPELSMNNVYENRKNHHDLIPHKALMVFAESNAGKQEIVQYLGINAQRIRVIPLFASEIIHDSVAASQPAGIDKDLFFIHYPAQYWAHKNHYNLLLAFEKVLLSFPSLKLVLTGSDKGNKDYVKALIREQGLCEKVLDLGFVETGELKWLYQHSHGLAMPTFLGPTNMPLLEAANLGCPVACSKLDGHIEQLGDYAYYFDPKDADEIAATICRMVTDKMNNVQHQYQDTFNITNAIQAMDAAFSDLKHIRFCWGTKDDIF